MIESELFSHPFVFATALQLVGEIIIKASVIALAAGTLSLLLRHASAAHRHAVWTLALALLALLPLLSALLPSWGIGRSDPLTAPPPAPAAVAGPVVPAADQPAGPPSAVPSRQAPPAGSLPVSSSAAAAVTVLTVVWLLGVLALLLRVVLHTAWVYRITSRASSMARPDLAGMAAMLASRLAIRRQVRIIISDEVSMPFSWGIWRPVIALPEAARRWDGCARSVLAHELAHIARWDYPLHLLAEAVRAFYWPNPLVWLAARRFALERERACDDVALVCGTPSLDYAVHLVEIARAQIARCALANALGMAVRSTLSERTRSIMNSNQDRSRVHPLTLLLAGIFCLALMLPIAALDMSQGRQQLAIPTTAELIEQLRHNEDPFVRQRAAWWLGEHEAAAAVQPLIDSLDDPSPAVRLVAGWALGEIKDRQAIPGLIETLDDDDPLVREMAALALGEIESPSAVSALVRACESDEELRAAVIWALGEIDGREAELARREAFSSWGRSPFANDEVWTGELDRNSRGSERHLPTLLVQLDSDAAALRRRAALTIGILSRQGELQTIAPVDPLLQALRDPDPQVRAAAVWSLDEINPSRWQDHHHRH
jgi:HEAT repeat protein